jgi:hypothetical protein
MKKKKILVDKIIKVCYNVHEDVCKNYTEVLDGC